MTKPKLPSKTATVVARILEEMLQAGDRPSIQTVRDRSAKVRPEGPISLRQMMRPEIKTMLDDARARYGSHTPTLERVSDNGPRRRKTHAEELAMRDRRISELEMLVDSLSSRHVERRAARIIERAEPSILAQQIEDLKIVVERLADRRDVENSEP